MTDSLQRWQKILALLHSPHEGEAMAALRALRAHLDTTDTKLTDLIPVSALQLLELQKELTELRAALAASQQETRQERATAAKWHTLAQNTADKLWEIGRELHAIDDAAHTHADSDPKIVRLIRR